MEVTTRTDIGKVRPNNEDSLLVCPPRLFAIADGMGGYNAGEVASKEALEELKAYQGSFPALRGEALDSRLHEMMRAANRRIYAMSLKEKDYEGMGTTLTGVYLTDPAADAASSAIGEAHIFNIGDSRLYLLRQGRLEQVTRDHSFVEELVDKGEISREEALTHPRRNMLTRGVGVEKEVAGDVFTRELEQDDLLLICSDGLSDMVRDEEMEAILLAHPLEEAADRLMEEALERGGKDNITFILVRIDGRIEEEKEGERHGR